MSRGLYSENVGLIWVGQLVGWKRLIGKGRWDVDMEKSSLLGIG